MLGILLRCGSYMSPIQTVWRLTVSTNTAAARIIGERDVDAGGNGGLLIIDCVTKSCRYRVADSELDGHRRARSEQAGKGERGAQARKAGRASALLRQRKGEMFV